MKKEENLPSLKFREELAKKLLTGVKYYASVYTINDGVKTKYEAWLTYKNKRFEVKIQLGGEAYSVIREVLLDELVSRLPYETKLTIHDFKALE